MISALKDRPKREKIDGAAMHPLRFARRRILLAASLIAFSFIGCGSSKKSSPNPAERNASKPANGRDTPPAADHRPTKNASKPTAVPEGRTVSTHTLFVNGEVITVDDILATAAGELGALASASTPEQYAPKMTELLYKSIVDAITERLVYQQATASGLFADLEDDEQGESPIHRAVDREIKREVNEIGRGSQARYEMRLSEMGLNLARRRESIQRRIVVEGFLRGKMGRKVDVSRRDLDRYYKEHIGEYQWGREVEPFIIELWIEKFLPDGTGPRQATQEQWTAARLDAKKTADAILVDLRERGVDFVEVCKQHSNAPNAGKGGRWGFIQAPIRGRNGVMLAPTKAALSMESGEISDPIESKGKIFIVKAGKVRPAGGKSFVEVQREIRAKLEHQQIRRYAIEYETNLRNKATISPVQPFLHACVMAAPFPQTSSP
jgi:parvulin-like peptidyl-prolyl isomerase